MNTRSIGWRASLLLLGATMAGCAAELPPFTRAPVMPPPIPPNVSEVVFLWPESSCDPSGYYAIATGDGKFIGNLGRGTRLHVTLPPGPYSFLGWNPPDEEARERLTPLSVAVLHADLGPGRVYYVRAAFGEWDDKGPRALFGIKTGRAVCTNPDHVNSVAFVPLRAASPLWGQLPVWLSELTPIAPDAQAGQAWLASRPEAFTAHRDIADSRYGALRPNAVALATVVADDGVWASR